MIQLFKNSSFPSEIMIGLSRALDYFGEVPLIIRSSSLLEDRFGTAFSGKYKSLFPAPTRGPRPNGWTPCWTRWPRCGPRCWGPIPSSTGANGGCRSSWRRWASSSRRWWAPRVGRYWLPRLCRGGLQPQRVPLVGPHQAGGRPGAGGAGPGHPGRGSHRRRLPGAGGAGAAGIASQRFGGRESCATLPPGPTSSTWTPTASRRWT